MDKRRLVLCDYHGVLQTNNSHKTVGTRSYDTFEYNNVNLISFLFAHFVIHSNDDEEEEEVWRKERSKQNAYKWIEIDVCMPNAYVLQVHLYN